MKENEKKEYEAPFADVSNSNIYDMILLSITEGTGKVENVPW